MSKKFKVNYEIVQLVLLGLIIIYGIALLAGLAIPVENKEAFAGVYSVILLLLSVSNLQKRIETNGDTTTTTELKGTDITTTTETKGATNEEKTIDNMPTV